MGGSLQDVVRYAANATSAGCRAFTPDASRRVGFSDGCLSVARWLELHGMCQRAGCRFLFGVNALSGRQRRAVPECSEIGEINQARRLVGGKAVGSHARALFAACTRWAGEWDPSHVAILLRAAAAHNVSTLAALSFGNEINGDKGMEAQLAPRSYARGLRQLAKLVAEIWPPLHGQISGEGGGIPRERPQLIAGDGNWNQEWYEQLVRLDVPVVALSYHHYYGQSRMRGLLGRVQSPR
jgi:heparanase 1